MPEETNPNDSGGKPNDDTAGLKSALEAALKKQRDAENQVKALRVEMGSMKQASDTTKSEMDKVMEKLTKMEERAATAERNALLASAKAATGLSDKKIAKLTGDTLDELLADARETFDWEDKPASDGKDGDGKDTSKDGDKSSGGRVATPPPKERLVPDPGARNEPATEDPISLAARIPRMFE